MRLLLAGATGFIGRHLVNELISEGHEAKVLTRDPSKAADLFGSGVTALEWDGVNVGPWVDAVDGADAVVNLCGESLAAGRWTAKRKESIIDSRVEPARALVSAIGAAARRPGTLINSSGIGYYGPAEDRQVTEDDPPGEDFVAGVCQRWEAEPVKAEEYGVRVVRLRCGVVLGIGATVLERFRLPFQLFVGGHLGSGSQPFPWVHLADVAGVVRSVLENPSPRGPINVVAPQIVSMKEFCRVLGRVMGRPSWAPVPAFLLRLVFGEMADILLTGQRAVPRQLRKAGYEFRYPELEDALREALG